MQVSPSNAARLADHRARLAARETNRLSTADRAAIGHAIAEYLRTIAEPTIADHYNGTQRAAYRSIGCSGYDLRQSEVDEISDTVAASILDEPYRRQTSRADQCDRLREWSRRSLPCCAPEMCPTCFDNGGHDSSRRPRYGMVSA